MRITALAALCTLQLALAGTLETDLRRAALGARNDFVVGAASEFTQVESTKGSKKSKDNSKDSNNSGNDNSQISSIESTETTEVILIWVNPGDNAATTTINSVAAASTVAAAATHTVVVGGSTKVYTPDTLEANIGDMVIFEFQAENHTATQSAFTSPCVALAGGKDTGFMPNINGTVNPPPQAAFAVQVSTPVWFYCRQKGHCGEGMTFSINPTADKTQADFQALAIQQNGTGSTAGIVATAPAAGSTVVSIAAAATSVISAPAATDASSSSSGLTTGQGTVNSDGSCSCAVICAPNSIPNVAAQGLNSFGGMGAK